MVHTKRLLLVLLPFLLVLTGCAPGQGEMDRGLELRSRLLAGEGCDFSSEIIADYGDRLFTFSLDCQGDQRGDLSFTVTAPETIGGIAGKIIREKGMLVFEDKALDFPLMAEGLISPVSAPWLFLKTLRGGSITAASTEGTLLHLSMDDSFEEDACHLDFWLDESNTPVRCEILHGGRRYLTMEIRNFRIR